jgi:hypothetical protein
MAAMPFRDDRDALLARITTLEAEVARAVTLRDQLLRAEAEARALREENARLCDELERFRAAEAQQGPKKAGKPRGSRTLLIAAALATLIGGIGVMMLAPEPAGPISPRPSLPAVPTPQAPPPPPPPAPPPPPQPTQQEIWDAYASRLCAGLMGCYSRNDFFGSFAFRLDGEIAPDGSVATATVEGDQPPEIRRCLVETLRERRLEGYGDGAARVRCESSGTLTSGTRMIMRDSTFTPIASQSD